MDGRPTLTQLAVAVTTVARVVGATQASYCFDGRIAVALSAGWSLVLSADDAGRFRLDAERGGRVRATMWSLVSDPARLAELAAAAQDEAAALAAR